MKKLAKKDELGEDEAKDEDAEKLDFAEAQIATRNTGESLVCMSDVFKVWLLLKKFDRRRASA